MSKERLLERREGHRRRVQRVALLYTPGGALSTGLFLYALANVLAGNAGAIFAMILMGMIAFAVDFEAIAAIRDLKAEPTETVGPVRRTWSKGRFLIFGRVHYVLIDRAVFDVAAETALDLRDGDTVRIEHWPHTHAVIAVHRVTAG